MMTFASADIAPGCQPAPELSKSGAGLFGLDAAKYSLNARWEFVRPRDCSGASSLSDL